MDRTGLTPSEGRRFGLTVGIAFLVLAAIFGWRGHDVLALGVTFVGTALVLGGLILPSRLGPVRTAWMSIGHLLSRITTPILLAILYFLVIGPIGLYLRVRGRNPLHRRPGGSGYWVVRVGTARRSNLRRQF